MANSPKKPHKKKPRHADKIGRNKAKCERYSREHRREKNKDRRAAKIQKRLAKAKAKKEGSADADPSFSLFTHGTPCQEGL